MYAAISQRPFLFVFPVHWVLHALKEQNLESFKAGWLEALGDLAR